MSKIKFVYFDVGGVALLDFTNTNKWAEIKKSLGVNKNNEELFDSVWQKHRKRICIDCDIDLLTPEFEEKTGIEFPKEYSMLEDFVSKFEQNRSIWPVMEFAKKKYKVGLLTNTYPRMLDLIRSNKIFPDIDWDVIVDSSLVGFQKPEDGIYEIAEKRSGVKPSEILFIDNLSKNIEVAKNRGWQVFWYDDQDPEKSSEKLYQSLIAIE
jgi:epoxide hydrolase-like predicted phosphatase